MTAITFCSSIGYAIEEILMDHYPTSLGSVLVTLSVGSIDSAKAVVVTAGRLAIMIQIHGSL